MHPAPYGISWRAVFNNRWLYRHVIAAALGIAVLGTPPVGAPASEDVPLGPLPDTVEPVRYRLELKILPDEERFSGRTEVDIRLKEAATRVWLHGQDLDVSLAHAVDAEGRKWPGHYRQVDSSGVAEVTFDAELPAGEVMLVFEYDAAFRRGYGSGLAVMNMHGENYVSSLMWSSAARRVFPAFDEPRFKIPYDVSIIAPAGSAVMSNAPELESEAHSGKLKRVRFATSEPLPTYLLGFSVGLYDVESTSSIGRSAVRRHEVPVRAFAAKGKGPKLQYVLESTAGILNVLEEYFGIAYPYAKLDLIAIPDSQSRGGMENAAAISYGEYDLLSDEESSILHNRDLVYLHAHELAHQWMGNLVTPVWWDDFWINESFATWLGHRAADRWAPGRDFERTELRWGLASMIDDSRADAEEIRPRIRTIAGMSGGLNQLMYAKGNAILSMFEHFVGEQPFRSGTRNYLRKYAQGTASTDDFLGAFEEGVLRSSSAPAIRAGTLGAAFRTFLDQPGVPLLDVLWSCGADTLELEIAQSRYLPLGSRLSAKQQWQLPFCVAYDESGVRRKHCELIDGAHAAVSVPVQECPAAIMPNAQGAGYYRFTMTPEKLNELAAQIAGLDPREALSFEDSLAAAMIAGKLGIGDYLSAVPAFAAYPAWDVASAPLPRLAFVLDHLVQGEDRARARAFVSRFYSSLVRDIGVTGESEFDRSHPDEAAQLRHALLPFLSLKARDAGLRSELLSLVDRTSADLDADLLELAFAVSVEEGGRTVGESLWERFRASEDSRFRESVLNALAAQTDPSLAEWARGLALDPDVEPGEAVLLLSRQAEFPENLPALWAWEKASLAELRERVKGYRQRTLISLVGNFCDTAAREDVAKIFRATLEELEAAPAALGAAVLDATLAQIEHCVAMKSRHSASAQAFFSDQAL